MRNACNFGQHIHVRYQVQFFFDISELGKSVTLNEHLKELFHFIGKSLIIKSSNKKKKKKKIIITIIKRNKNIMVTYLSLRNKYFFLIK